MKVLQQKKVIVVTGGAWNHEIAGGAYKVATEFAEFLAEQGHKVFYIAASKEAEITNPTHYRNVEVWRYPSPTAKSPSLLNLFSHFSQCRKLVNNISKKHTIDHVNGHDYLQFLGVLKILKKAGTISTSFGVHSPLVLEHLAHWGVPIDDANMKTPWNLGLKRVIALQVHRRVEKMVYSCSDKIITFSHFTKNKISRDYVEETKGKTQVSHLWVDLEKYRLPTTDRKEIRKGLGGGWVTDEIVFFTLRRLVPRMGIDNLVNAMSLLRKQGFNGRLIIGGAGPEKENLEQLVKDLELEHCIEFIGKVPDDNLLKCYQAADCFLLPTRSLECFGLIILESYASGTPVIATPVGSIPEVMGSIGKQFLTEDTTPESLAKTMRAFIDKRLDSDGTALREYAEQFSFRERAELLSTVALE